MSSWSLSDALTQSLSVSMDSDAQQLKNQSETGDAKKPKKKKKGLTTQVCFEYVFPTVQ